MQNPRLKVILSLLLTFSSYEASASFTRENFLSHGPSAVAYGRGETGTSYLNDLSSFYYNPSLLAYLKRGSLALSHYFLFDGSMYSFAGFSLGNVIDDKTNFSLSAVNLQSGKVEVRQKINDTPQTAYSNQLAVFVTAARHFNILTGFNLGINAKYLYFDIYKHTAGSPGLDLGLSRTFDGPYVLKNRSTIPIGFSIQNLLRPKLKLLENPEEYPTILRFGSGFQLPLFYRYNPQKKLFFYDRFSFLFDLVFNPSDEEFKYSLGFEYGVLARYFLRAGLNDTPTLGIGYRHADLQIDYAIDFKPYTLFHRVALAFYWGEVPEEEEEDYIHYRQVYSRVERLYQRHIKLAQDFIEQKKFSDAVQILERTAFLLPEKNDPKILLKQAQDLSAAQKSRDTYKKIENLKSQGNLSAAYQAATELLQYLPGDKLLTTTLDSLYSDSLAKNITEVIQIRQNSVDDLTSSIKKALSKFNFDEAKLNLLRMKTIAPELPLIPDLEKEIQESRSNRIAELLSKSEKAFSEKHYATALQFLCELLHLDPALKHAVTLKDQAMKNIKTLNTRERLYADRLYYLAAEHFAHGETKKAKDTLNELVQFNPSHRYVSAFYLFLLKQ